MAHGDDADLIRRAIAAHYRTARAGEPAPGASRVTERGGMRYVVLADADSAVVGVYRIRYDGILRAMKRWPREIEQP